MCFYVFENENIKTIAKRFKAQVERPEEYVKSDFIVGFSYPNLPVILNTSPQTISTDLHWGLIPSWAKEADFRKNTLNARIETIHEKPSFRGITNNRCLVIASGYYEWHWDDPKGKSKTKYLIRSKEDKLFALAGLYDLWVDKSTGEILKTFTIVTTEANEMMKEIHNHAGRMPVMLKKEDEKLWLNLDHEVDEFAYPYSADLMAIQL